MAGQVLMGLGSQEPQLLLVISSASKSLRSLRLNFINIAVSVQEAALLLLYACPRLNRR